MRRRNAVAADVRGGIKTAQKMRLPWWGVLCVVIGAVPVFWLFDHFGRFDLARPALYSVAMLSIAIAVRWELRPHPWFWVTMGAVAALHALLVLPLPWTTKWFPAVAIIPIGMADLYAVLAILAVVRRLV